MSENKELHADFFLKWADETRLQINLLDDDGLLTWRNEMSRIALEAKVKTATADEEIRVRKAKKIKESKPWLSDLDVQDSLSQVTTRAKRLSKEEKLLAMMKDLGVEGSGQIIKSVKTENLRDFKVINGGASKEAKDDTPFDFSKLTD